jgi:cytochrome P450
VTAGVPSLGDPATFAGGVPHQLLADLRATTPVAWQELDGQAGFWAVLRHADVVAVARDPATFSAGLGGVVVEDLDPESLELMRGMLLAMDPPRHGASRRPLAERFKAQVIAGMEPQVRAICRDLLGQAAEQGQVELVHQVAAGLPSRVIGQLMGLPEDDWARIHALAERQASGQDPELAPPGAAGSAGAAEPDGASDAHEASVEMALYAIDLASHRLAAMGRGEEPPADLTTLLLAGGPDGDPISEVEFGSLFVQLVVAGNDTTRTMLSSGVHALATHPDELARLRARPELVPGAVEEVLRWANPLHCFRRTATVDAELGGQAIAAGDKVAMYYTSANRDEAVFDDPDRFDVGRRPNPHLSFGIGEHFCLGVHLARLEGRVFLEELLAGFEGIELAGEPVRVRSNLVNGFSRLPVALTPTC